MLERVLAWKATVYIGKDTMEAYMYRKADVSAMTLVAARVVP